MEVKRNMQKVNREQIFEMLDSGMTNAEIAQKLDVSRNTVSRAKQEWNNGRTFTPVEKIAADDLTGNTKIAEASTRIHKLEPLVLNAIYRSEKWQTVFFSDKYNAYFDGDDKINKTIFEFLRYAVKKVGYMPSQDRISEMFDDSLRRAKTPFKPDEIEDLNDMFDKVIWSLDEDIDWLSEKCHEYITVTESMVFCEKAMKLIRGEGSVSELKCMMEKAYKQIDIPDETSYDLCDKIHGSVSSYFPFFIPTIEQRIKGIPTGVSIFCGLTGTGKTHLCVNQEVHLAKHKIASLHFCLGDITAREYQCRVLAHLSQFKYHDITRDETLQDRLIEKYYDILKYIRIVASTDAKTIQAYLRDADNIRKRQASERKPIANFICFDYDDLIGTKSSQEWDRAEEIYEAAQQYGIKNSCCIVMVSQPTKECEIAVRSGTRSLQLTDVSGGKKKICKSAIVIGMTAMKKEDPDAELKPVKFSVLKGRYGGDNFDVDGFLDGDKCTYILGLVSNDKLEPVEDEFNGFENELPF